MKKNKTIILVTIVLIYLIALVAVILGNDKAEKKQKNNAIKRYIVVDNFARLSFFNNSWHNVSTSEIEAYKEKYNIYINNNMFGSYKLKYGNTWNLFNDTDDYVNYEGSLFAYSKNSTVSLKNTIKREISDNDKKNILKFFNYNDFNNLVTNDVIDLDIDQNGIEDEVVCVSNIGIDEKDKDKYYNLIYIKLNNKIIKVLNENSTNSDILQKPVYNLSNLFELKNNKYLLVKKTIGIDSDYPQESPMLYQYNNKNNFKKIKINSQ